MTNPLFARKPIADLVADTERGATLRRALGPWSLTSLGIGAIIGSGIFVMTGRVAADDAGPAVLLSFLVAGIGCAFAALCYAEFASMVPVAGSAYTYAYAALGEIFAWMIGWDLILEYAMSGAVIADSWTEYFDEFLRVIFGWHLPDLITKDPFTTHGQSWLNLPAVLIMMLVMIVLVVGIRESAAATSIMVIIKVAVVIFVIAVGMHYVTMTNFTDIPVEARKPIENAAEKWGLLSRIGIDRWLIGIDDRVRSPFAPYGVSGIVFGASIVFFAYLGFDAVSCHAEEAKVPSRDVPFAIIASLVICTILYIGVAAVITGMEPYPQIDVRAAAASAFRHRAEAEHSPLLRAAAGLIATGALAGMTSTMLVTFLGQARIFFAMARDGLLPKKMFAEVHPRFRTPYRSTILTCCVTAVVAAFTPIDKLEEMINIGTLMAFVVVCVAVMMLRVQRPEQKRPFRCPALFIVGPLGILSNLVMMLFLPVDTWVRLFVWLAAGLAIYFLYGKRHSTLRLAALAKADTP